jgi:hypothetical protein
MLPDRVVLDGEVVVATHRGLDFDALGQRIHPAESRINRLAGETPASFVAFDLVALGDDDHRSTPFGERRRYRIVGGRPPHLTPITDDAIRGRLVPPLRGGRVRRGHGQAGRRPVPVGQAVDPEDQASAHRRHGRRGTASTRTATASGSLLLGLHGRPASSAHRVA